MKREATWSAQGADKGAMLRREGFSYCLSPDWAMNLVEHKLCEASVESTHMDFYHSSLL